MLNEDAENSSGFAELVEELGLQPQQLEPIENGQFLQELHQFTERALTAPGLLVRAIDARGEVEIAKEPSWFQPRLRALANEGIKLYNAYADLRGQERLVDLFVKHLRSATWGGEPAKLAIIFKGPSGTGKSMLVENTKNLLEGQIVYAVQGCPVHENPLSLLNLLSAGNSLKMIERFHLAQTRSAQAAFMKLLQELGKPCKHCRSLVVHSDTEPDPNRAFVHVKVIPTRLSAYEFGVGTFTDGTMQQFLRESSRGIADFGELFAGFENPEAGSPVHSAKLFQVLHDVLNDKRIKGGEEERSRQAEDDRKSKPSDERAVAARGWEPIDVVAVAQTNQGAYEGFMKSLGKDGNKITRLICVFDVLHNTSVVAEVMAYLDKIGIAQQDCASSLALELPNGVHLDPLALRIFALVGILSRREIDKSFNRVLRTRLDDGENVLVKRTSPAGDNNPEHWILKDMWQEFDKKDGASGINMPTMLMLWGELLDHVVAEGHKCVSTLEMLKFVRQRLIDFQKRDGFTNEEKSTFSSFEKYLELVRKEEQPKELESEVRRLMKELAMQIGAADYKERLHSYFVRFWLHGTAAAAGKKTVFDESRHQSVNVDTKFLLDVEEQCQLKRWDSGASGAAKRQQLRTMIDDEVIQRRQKGNLLPVAVSDFPELERPLRAYLDKEVAARVERLLKDESQLDLKDRALKQKAIERLTEMGYRCQRCRNAALQYIMDYKLWSYSDDSASN